MESRMETHAYNELYLSDAMYNMAVMMHCGINGHKLAPGVFFQRFISSGIAAGFEKGNPRFLVGYSGAELADLAISLTGGVESASTDGSYYVSPEYWAGWVLAYYQWKSGRSFKYMKDNGLDIETVLLMYNPLHEADIEKFANVADSIISRNMEERGCPLKRFRIRRGLTQKELADLSGTSIRMIRAYEQGSQDISKAEYRTVKNLSSALKVNADDIIY